MRGRTLCLSILLVACGDDTTSTGATSTGEASTGATSTGEASTSEASTSTTSTEETSTGEPASWPRRATLVTMIGGEGSQGVHLADGASVAGGGDLTLVQTMVLTIGGPTPLSICEKGTFAALAEVPTTVESCPASLTGTWVDRARLSAAAVHTIEESSAAGLGLLAWDPEHTTLYRLRVVGDSYDADGVSTVVFDYEPAP